MELPINENPEFTEWLVREGVLVEPFVLIDVGVQDGEDGRWRVLGDHLVVHGSIRSRKWWKRSAR